MSSLWALMSTVYSNTITIAGHLYRCYHHGHCLHITLIAGDGIVPMRLESFYDEHAVSMNRGFALGSRCGYWCLFLGGLLVLFVYAISSRLYPAP